MVKCLNLLCLKTSFIETKIKVTVLMLWPKTTTTKIVDPTDRIEKGIFVLAQKIYKNECIVSSIFIFGVVMTVAYFYKLCSVHHTVNTRGPLDNEV